MSFTEFRVSLKYLPIFSLKEVIKLYPLFDRRRLTEWKNKGYITQIAKGFYCFSETTISEEFLFYCSNKIYDPSYISLETAFSYYNLIPEGSFSQTAVSPNKTTTIKSQLANFSYRKIKPSLYFGYRVINLNGGVYRIAEVEKCLLDYLYLNPSLNSKEKILELRFDFDHFKETADLLKLNEYLLLFNNKELTKRLNIFEQTLS